MCDGKDCGGTCSAVTSDQPKNTYTILEGELALQAVGRRIIVKEDRFRTGFECKECDGECVILSKTCSFCQGTGTETGKDVHGNETPMPCRMCRGSKHPICKACNGKGGLLIAPEVAERRPTSGVVMSVGADVGICECTLNIDWQAKNCTRCGGTGRLRTAIKVGDHILYGNYAGTSITFKNKSIVRIMNEEEVISLIYAAKEFNFGKVTA